MSEHYETAEATPDLDELLQIDTPRMETVPVRVEEAVETWALPNRRVRMDSQLVGDSTTGWVKVLDPSKKRSRATLMPNTNPVRLRTSSSGLGALWPANTAFHVTHTQGVYAQCASAGLTTEIGIVEEFWSD
jgi:hypothetical protein